MSLRSNLRGLRAAVVILACAGLTLSPAIGEAAATAKPKKKLARALRKAQNKRPAGKTVLKATMTPANGLGNRIALPAATQLAAMNTGIQAGPTFFNGLQNGCGTVTAMLTSQPGQVMAGNFRDGFGDCYVWLNLGQSSMLTGSEICKLALHEMGHLGGLDHSTDVLDVMFAPFRADPIPAPCSVQPVSRS